MPKISVIMAVYNSSKYVSKAVKSILQQSMRDFEFIIVNDGCTDSTMSIIKSFKDVRVRLIDNNKNLGLTKSLNVALKFVKGRYVARMDADDYSLAERFAVQCAFLDEYDDYGVVGSSINVINEAGSVIKGKSRPRLDDGIKFYMIQNNPFIHSSVMIRKTCLDRVKGYNEAFEYAQDYDLFTRLSFVCKMHNTSKVWHYWRRVPGGISATKSGAQSQYAKKIAIKYIKRLSSSAVKISDGSLHRVRLGEYAQDNSKLDGVVEDILRRFPSCSKTRIWVYEYFKKTKRG